MLDAQVRADGKCGDVFWIVGSKLVSTMAAINNLLLRAAIRSRNPFRKYDAFDIKVAGVDRIRYTANSLLITEFGY